MLRILKNAYERQMNKTILDKLEGFVTHNLLYIFASYVFMTLYQMVIFMDSYYIVPVIMAFVGCLSSVILHTVVLQMTDMCRENEYNILNTKISAVIHGIKSGINHF